VLKKIDMQAQAYRDAMARFAGAVHIVTTDGEAGRRGATVIAACSVSDAPPTILVCVNFQNPRNDAFLVNGRFALNTLAVEHEALSIGFSGVTGLTPEERFALGKWDTISTGSPTLVGALAVFDCELVEAKEMSTHRVLFGKVTGLRNADNLDPLLYFNRSYRAL
jgi:cob(II)yrinic acid a,c-diamide reductase